MKVGGRLRYYLPHRGSPAVGAALDVMTGPGSGYPTHRAYSVAGIQDEWTGMTPFPAEPMTDILGNGRTAGKSNIGSCQLVAPSGLIILLQ